MAQAIPFSDFVAIVAPLPRPGAVVEGWMARIRAVDEIFLDCGRVYLNFDASTPVNDPPPMARFGDAVEFRIHPLSEKHRATVEAVILASRFTYVHTVHLARFVLSYLPTGKILVDFHGATPEEEEMLGNPVNAEFYAGVERAVIAGVRWAVVVTEAMITHLRVKYPDCACEFILLPIMESHDFDLARRTPSDDGRYTVIYAGGTQTWQNLPLMLDAAARANVDCRYVFLSHDQKRIAAESARVCPKAEIELGVAGREDLPGYYARADLGFVLRDDTTVNRVACPTKLIEYMQFGIVPIVKSPQVGDFPAYGFEYVALEEFIDGLIPNRAQLSRMAQINLAILNRVRAHFSAGAERLRALSLPNLVVGGGVRGLPIGLEPLTYPARRELYIFGDPNKYVADWIIGPYVEHVFQADGAIGQLIRVVPVVMDFSCSEMAIEIEAAASGEVQIEVVQSRGRRIGGRDYFRGEAPFIEIKVSRPVTVSSVGLKLSEAAFGPLIWRTIGLSGLGSAPEGGVLRVALVINGQRSEKSIAVKYV